MYKHNIKDTYKYVYIYETYHVYIYMHINLEDKESKSKTDRNRLEQIQQMLVIWENLGKKYLRFPYSILTTFL